MIARFTNFTNNTDLKDCIFELPKTLSGLYKLEAVYDSANCKPIYSDWFYTYDQVLDLENFYIKNKNTSTGSTYKTSGGFIKRLLKELK